jgi:hypothetical protein
VNRVDRESDQIDAAAFNSIPGTAYRPEGMLVPYRVAVWAESRTFAGARIVMPMYLGR